MTIAHISCVGSMLAIAGVRADGERMNVMQPTIDVSRRELQVISDDDYDEWDGGVSRPEACGPWRVLRPGLLDSGMPWFRLRKGQ
jgi:hypothetical protein